MLAFLNLLETKYGGVEAYLHTHASLTDSDLATIRSNFTITPPPSS
jgi:hypothetical protein